MKRACTASSIPPSIQPHGFGAGMSVNRTGLAVEPLDFSLIWNYKAVAAVAGIVEVCIEKGSPR